MQNRRGFTQLGNRVIEVEYNRTRLRKHPVYGYVTPVETRALTAQDLAPAA
ncbi:hypothetical protein ACFVJK_39200 [Streptomyces sp. NPDC127172]|uniref:hypothetical protein n=1 Tax=Streptomyces sp. NPDC127172 TaxID=3345382 RepID=UPI0036279DBA